MEHRTEAAKLRSEWAHNASEVMIGVVRAITKRSKLITGLALGASTPHQIVYLLALCVPHMHLSTSVDTVQLVQNYLEALGMIIIALAVPICTDITIYSCVDTLGAMAATKTSKIRAFIFLLIPLGASGFVNFLAPAPMILKGLAAFLVVLVMISQGLKFVDTDWDKLEEFEAQNTIVEEAPSRPGRRPVTARERRARERDLYAAMTKTEQYKWRLKWDADEQKRLAKLQTQLPAVPETATVG
jgi:hypothetical protein